MSTHSRAVSIGVVLSALFAAETAGAAPLPITVFREAGFRGASQVIPAGGSIDRAFVNAIASVRVPRGMRLTLCEKGNLQGTCRSYTGDTANLDAAIDRKASYARVEEAMWGFADLHVHPAAHYGWGGDASGNGGVFWGRPGMRLEDSSSAARIAADMPSCDGEKHGGFDADLVRHSTRKVLVETTLEIGLPGQPHGPHGFDADPRKAFSDWPTATSLPHQQIHVTWLRRAYEGGLRMIIANASDTQAISMLWQRSYAKPAPSFDRNFDFESAKRQLAFLREFAAANSSWMEVALTSAQARTALANNKLVVILGLEFDTLTLEQIKILQRDHGVRHVIPIHLADNNDFGGTAINQTDVFNSSNHFLNGGFFDVAGDPYLRFRLNKPQYLRYIPVNPGHVLAPIGTFIIQGVHYKELPGAMVPTSISDADYARLGYDAALNAANCVGGCGHRNKKGLTKPENFRELMKSGLIIDIVHASDSAHEQAITLAEAVGYPLMNSHSGLRPDSAPSDSERQMRVSLGARMAKLGGVLGMGTVGMSQSAELPSVAVAGSVTLTGASREWSIGTGAIPLAGHGRFELTVQVRPSDAPCPLGQEQGGSMIDAAGRSHPLCYAKCRDGYHGIATMCHKDCPPGFTDTILHCTKPISGPHGPYVRGAGYVDAPSIYGKTSQGRGNGYSWDPFKPGPLQSGQARCQNDFAQQGCEEGSPTIWYPRCAAGWDGVGPVCWQKCRPGYNNDGATCRRDGMDIARERCARDNPQGCEAVGAIIYPKCRQGYHPFGSNICSPDCPTGMSDVGAGCQKNGSYDRGVGKMQESPVPPDATLSASMKFKGGTVTVPMTPSGGAFLFTANFPVPAGGPLGDALSVTVRLDGGTKATILGAKLRAVTDPMHGWAQGYVEMNKTMLGAIALGTDMNGYAPTVPWYSGSIQYPLGVATNDFRLSGPRAASLPISTTLTKAFDFAKIGLAHYGLLPEFLEAVRIELGGQGREIERAFHSAHDVVQLWERAELVAKTMAR